MSPGHAPLKGEGWGMCILVGEIRRVDVGISTWSRRETRRGLHPQYAGNAFGNNVSCKAGSIMQSMELMVITV